MSQSTRRTLVKNAVGLMGGIGAAKVFRAPGVLAASRKKTDVRIEEIAFSYEEFPFRTPLGFAQAVLDRQTMLTVDCTVRTAAGKVAKGFAKNPLNYVFTFPTKKMTPEARLSAMKSLAEELAKVTGGHRDYGHPIDINWALAPRYVQAAAAVAQRLRLPDPIPKLCILVTAAAFDAAVHDAFGKAHGLNCFRTYGPEFMNHDLSHYLGAEYRGDYPARFLRKDPKPQMPLCHLVSAKDPIEASDVKNAIKDGLPETLAEWIEYNGLTYFKIKVNGEDLKWDVDRVMHVDRVTTAAQKKRGVGKWSYVLDFNEKCPNVDYFLRFLRELKEKMPAGFARIEYVEQPTARDLAAHPENVLTEAAKLCPSVIDESLIDIDAILLARKQGWSGAVVKSQKGLTHMLMANSVAGKHNLLVAGGDMSCPGAALIQTANLQARVPTITSLEANARQFMPAANKPWEPRFPGMFHITDGMLKTGVLDKPGLVA